MAGTARFLVSGLINMETTVKIRGFPIPYFPIDYPFFGVNSTVSGVAINIATALSALGTEPLVSACLGSDSAGELTERLCAERGWATAYLHTNLKQTPQSVILYDESGRRQIYCDLKDIQETRLPSGAETVLTDCDCAILCNINFNRPLLALARAAGVPVATDVHLLSDPDDPYNRDFLEAADILFMSDEALPSAPEDFARALVTRYRFKVLVIGLGEKGALLFDRTANAMHVIGAQYTRPVVNTVGAGDALFSSFLHYYLAGYPPLEALQRAVLFASWKIGENGAASGFASAEQIEQLLGGRSFRIDNIC